MFLGVPGYVTAAPVGQLISTVDSMFLGVPGYVTAAPVGQLISTVDSMCLGVPGYMTAAPVGQLISTVDRRSAVKNSPKEIWLAFMIYICQHSAEKNLQYILTYEI